MNIELLKQEKKTYAIVGATNNKEKYGNRVLLNLRAKGFDVVPINPHDTQIEGIKAYRTLSEAAGEHNIDAAVFVIPPEKTIAVLDEMKSLGINDAWFQPGSESEQARVYCDNNGINCVMNACIMVATD